MNACVRHVFAYTYMHACMACIKRFPCMAQHNFPFSLLTDDHVFDMK